MKFFDLETKFFWRKIVILPPSHRLLPTKFFDSRIFQSHWNQKATTCHKSIEATGKLDLAHILLLFHLWSRFLMTSVNAFLVGCMYIIDVCNRYHRNISSKAFEVTHVCKQGFWATSGTFDSTCQSLMKWNFFSTVICKFKFNLSISLINW